VLKKPKNCQKRIFSKNLKIKFLFKIFFQLKNFISQIQSYTKINFIGSHAFVVKSLLKRIASLFNPKKYFVEAINNVLRSSNFLGVFRANHKIGFREVLLNFNFLSDLH
jgi:hypothetical protein